MENFGAKEAGQASASGTKQEKRGRKGKQKQSNAQSEASPNEPKKRGRKPVLTEEQRHENTLENSRRYRKNKAAKFIALEGNVQELERQNKRWEEGYKKLEEEKKVLQSEKEELLERDARADKMLKELKEQKEQRETAKMMNETNETGMQSLQQKFLNQDDEDPDGLRKGLEKLPLWIDPDTFFYGVPDFLGSPSGEGTSAINAKLSPLRETVTFNGFRVLKENSTLIEQILSDHPNITLDLKFRCPTLRNGVMDTLAEVYKMTNIDKLNQEEIKQMDSGIHDLELAGLHIPGLKEKVDKARTRSEVAVNKKNHNHDS